MAIERTARIALLSVILICLATSLSARPPGAGIDGTWAGRLDLGDRSQDFAVQLYQRADGNVIGYVLGGTSFRQIIEGSFDGARLRLAIELANSSGGRSVRIDAALRGRDNLEGVVMAGTSLRPLLWRRTFDSLEERQFGFFLPDAEGNRTAFTRVAIVTDPRGRLVSGTFVGLKDCAFLACDGNVTRFRDDLASTTFEIESADRCSRASSIVVDPIHPLRKAYQGTYTFRGCDTTTTGVVLGVRGATARSEHIGSMLEAIAGVADDLEAHRRFGGVHASFDPAYFHSGVRLPALFEKLNAEIGGPEIVSLDVVLSRFRSANTVEDRYTLPELDLPFGIEFVESRRHPPAAPYRLVEMKDLRNAELRFFRQDPKTGRWRIYGDQSPPFNFPFGHQFLGNYLLAGARGGDIFLSLGSWGAHFQPMTGHAFGDTKADLLGYFTLRLSDLTELAPPLSDGNGICEPGEKCGLATDEATLRDRALRYQAPMRAVLTDVEYAPAGDGFLDPGQWVLKMNLSNGLRLTLDHCARIAPALAARIRATGLLDPDHPPADARQFPGFEIPLERFEEVAFAQVHARPGPPGLFVGTFGNIPRVQIEFKTFGPVDRFLADVCMFEHLPAGYAPAMQARLDGDLADGVSQRFAERAAQRWRWSAEATLCPRYSAEPTDFRSIDTRLGGWFERPTPGVTPDEIFSIVPISTASASYDPALYSPGVTQLVLRQLRTGSGSVPFVVDGVTYRVDYPAGEVLARDPSQLIVKWRDPQLPSDVYQRVGYALDASGLTLRFGALSPLRAVAEAAPLPAGSCNGNDVVCYDHFERRGF